MPATSSPASATATLAAIHILFPDPWPKKRHLRRRFLQPATIAEIHRLLRPGGRFVFVSDAGDYAAATLQLMLAHGGFAWTAEGLPIGDGPAPADPAPAMKPRPWPREQGRSISNSSRMPCG